MTCNAISAICVIALTTPLVFRASNRPGPSANPPASIQVAAKMCHAALTSAATALRMLRTLWRLQQAGGGPPFPAAGILLLNAESLPARPCPPVRPNKLEAAEAVAMIGCYVDHTAHPLSKDASTRSLKPKGQEDIIRVFAQNTARPSCDPPSTSGSHVSCASICRRPEHPHGVRAVLLSRPILHNIIVFEFQRLHARQRCALQTNAPARRTRAPLQLTAQRSYRVVAM